MDLVEIHEGRRVLWLEPRARPGRPGVREDVEALRGGYAAAMEVFVANGRSVRNAARDVLRKIPSDSMALRGINDLKLDVVKRWRDGCTGKVESSAMKAAFDWLLAKEKAFPGSAADFLKNPHTNFLKDPT